MTRIGIVGIENSHADHLVRYLNVDERFGDDRVTALVAGEADRTAALRSAGGPQVEHVVADATDLVGLVDAAVVCTRDGAAHRAQAVPLLEAGIPVLVDKPLAASPDDAEQILACAERTGTPVVSLSALRRVPELALIRDGVITDGVIRDGVTMDRPANLGSLLGLHIIGSGSASSPYSGLWFYGIHHVEAALEVCGAGPIGEVAVRVVPNLVAATTTIGPVAVTLSFVDDAVGHTPWAATAIGSAGTVHTPLTLGPDYALPVLETFLDMVATGRQPYPTDDMLRPIRLLAEIDTRRREATSAPEGH